MLGFRMSGDGSDQLLFALSTGHFAACDANIRAAELKSHSVHLSTLS